MNNSILILGDSGTGKSTSFRNLPASETFVINVLNKPLPFRGSTKKFTALSKDGMTGNYYTTDKGDVIKRVINLVNTKRPEIKYLIIDDFGYVAMNAYMNSIRLKGFDKFNEIGEEFKLASELFNKLRDDLFCIVTMHIETDAQGKTKPKTIGNVIDKHITVEGRFTHVFHTYVSDRGFKFITNNDGLHMAKSPMGLFDDLYIDNDMLEIANKINEYNNEVEDEAEEFVADHEVAEDLPKESGDKNPDEEDISK